MQESSLPDGLIENGWVSPNAATRSRSNGSASRNGMIMGTIDSSSPSTEIENHQISSPTNPNREGHLHVPSLMTPITAKRLIQTLLTWAHLVLKWRDKLFNQTTWMKNPVWSLPLNAAAESVGSSGYPAFLEPDAVNIPSISVSLAPLYHGIQRIQVTHRDVLLQLCCTRLKVRFGVSTKFVDYAGRPRLSFVVDATPNLCRVLDACDGLAQKLSVDSGSSSEWRPIVTRKGGFMNLPTVRFQ